MENGRPVQILTDPNAREPPTESHSIRIRFGTIFAPLHFEPVNQVTAKEKRP